MTEAQEKKPGRNALLDTLATTFAVFRDVRPLALGIHKTLQERMPELTKDQVRTALRSHTGSTRYLKALAQAKERYDLDGNPAGEVTEEQRAQAAEQLKERFRKAAERRQEEEQAKKRQENLLKLAEKFNSR
ncbi:MAG: ProQ activator of osmoprotectant transporter prop [Thiobacillus sp.]|nr:ProQ activator of osmoprotectant transporter prop [Thiobacillus sp.]